MKARVYTTSGAVRDLDLPDDVTEIHSTPVVTKLLDLRVPGNEAMPAPAELPAVRTTEVEDGRVVFRQEVIRNA